MRIRPGSEVEHGDGHTKATAKAKGLADCARGIGYVYERRFTGSWRREECRDGDRFEDCGGCAKGSIGVGGLAGAVAATPRIRYGHELPGRQIAESALIRNRAMAQQLCQHAQGLVCEILVDEGFLPR